MKKLAIALCLILLLCLSMPAFPQSKGMRIYDPDTKKFHTIRGYENSYAVCIGINEYKFWPQLSYAVSDAVAMKEKLEERGFTEVKLVTNEEATQKGILSAISWLGTIAGEEDRVVIYFSGHGETEEGIRGQTGYIIPVNCPDTGYYANAISMGKIREATNLIRAKHILYVMDCCYSGVGLVRPRSRDDFIDRMTEYPCVYMITAGQAGEEALETGGHGIFTQYVLRGLDGEADYDNNRVITGTELGQYTQTWVIRKAEQLNRTQTPQFGRMDGEGEIVFVLETQAATLIISSIPDKAVIRINGVMQPEVTPAELTMLPDEYTITLEHDDYDPYIEKVTLIDGQIHLIEEAPLPPQTQLYVTSVPPGSRIDLGELGVYQTPAMLPGVKPGDYRVRASIRGCRDTVRRFSVMPHTENRLELQLFPCSRSQMAWRSLFIPGWGQYYGGRYGTGTLFLLAGVGAAAGAAISYIQYGNAVDEYDISVKRYNDAFEPDEFQSAKRAMIDAHDSADGKFAFRQAMFIAAGVVWGANMAHVLIAGPVRAPESPQAQAELPQWQIAPRVMPDSLSVMFAYRF